MTTAWAHLPNARHIDAILADVNAHHERWAVATEATWGDDVARGDAARDAALAAAWNAAWSAACDAARHSARHATFESARSAIWDAVRHDACIAVRNAALDACLALIAWDDAGQLMDVPIDTVRTMAAAGHHPAVFLLPARLAMEAS